jgi:predicted RNase H-like HicB family nuclease
MKYNIEYEQEDDGRWIAEIPSLPGAMVYGETKEEAANKVISLALKALSEEMSMKVEFPSSLEVSLVS